MYPVCEATAARTTHSPAGDPVVVAVVVPDDELQRTPCICNPHHAMQVQMPVLAFPLVVVALVAVVAVHHPARWSPASQQGHGVHHTT
jgi:hypothetical protein